MDRIDYSIKEFRAAVDYILKTGKSKIMKCLSWGIIEKYLQEEDFDFEPDGVYEPDVDGSYVTIVYDKVSKNPLFEILGNHFTGNVKIWKYE